MSLFKKIAGSALGLGLGFGGQTSSSEDDVDPNAMFYGSYSSSDHMFHANTASGISRIADMM